MSDTKSPPNIRVGTGSWVNQMSILTVPVAETPKLNSGTVTPVGVSKVKLVAAMDGKYDHSVPVSDGSPIGTPSATPTSRPSISMTKLGSVNGTKEQPVRSDVKPPLPDNPPDTNNFMQHQVYWTERVARNGADIKLVPMEHKSEVLCLDAVTQDIKNLTLIPNFKYTTAIYRVIVERLKQDIKNIEFVARDKYTSEVYALLMATEDYPFIEKYVTFRFLPTDYRTRGFSIYSVKKDITNFFEVPRCHHDLAYYKEIAANLKTKGKGIGAGFIYSFKNSSMMTKEDKLRLLHYLVDNQISFDIYDLNGFSMFGRDFNKLMQGKPLVRLFNEEKEHNGFQFKEGTNTDTKMFDPTGSCKAGGLYFVERSQWREWKSYNNKVMKWYSVVTIPDDSMVYIENVDGKKFKCTTLLVHSFVPLDMIDSSK